ncbi:MAG: HAD family phosphatase [Ruminococcaceae bacterium]|nr:HAD family phosphatase [Oscillospiraceae bacterium]
MIKGIIFDFNGTLFFDSHIHFEAFDQFLTSLGKTPPPPELRVATLLGRTNRQCFRTYYDENASDDVLDSLADRKEAIYRSLCLSHPEYMHLVKGAEELLDYLKAHGIPYAIATGSRKDNMDFYFRHLGLARWFSYDNIIYDDQSFQGKPAPDIYLKTADRLGLIPSECLVFEDGDSGVLAAHRAGIAAIGVIHEPSVPAPNTGDIVIDSIANDFTHFPSVLSRHGLLKEDPC